MKGEWRQLNVTPPLDVMPGDSLKCEQTTLQHIRNGYVIGERDLTFPGVEVPNETFGQSRSITELFYFREQKMPAVSVTLVDVTVSQPTGAITVKFSDGENLEFGTFADLISNVQDLDTDGDVARKLLMLRLIRYTPDGSDLDALNGSTCTIDGAAATPVQFSLTA